MSNVSRYPKQVFWSDEDEGYIAVAPDLPGSSAFGDTEQEALQELDSAIDAWIEAAQAAGNPVPKPSQPARDIHFSGKTMVRMPKSLHAKLVHDAQFDGVSLNQHINRLLSEASTVSAVERIAQHSILGLMETQQSILGAIERLQSEAHSGSFKWHLMHQHVMPSAVLNLEDDHWSDIDNEDPCLEYDVLLPALPAPQR